MIDVVPSVSLDQRLDCPHDPVSFPAQFNLTPAFITNTHSTHLQIPDLNLALLGGFDFSGEQIFDPTSLDIQNWLAMLQQVQTQQSDQDLPHSPQTQSPNPRQFNDIAYQYSEAQQTMLPSFVEPSGNYFEIPSTTVPTPFLVPPSALPTASPVNNTIGPRSYVNTTVAAQHGGYNQHHPSSRSSQLLTANNFQLTQGGTNYSDDNVPGHHYLPQRMIYANPVPSLSTVGTRQHPQNHYHRKSIPAINTTSLPPSPTSTFSRSNSAASSPVNQPLLTSTIAQVLNPNDDENTMQLPMFESNNPSPTAPLPAWTSPAVTTITIPQNISVSSSPEIASPTTPTYSYSGPPKSYYSRLPLYDRPFKCDQCPQSFNRNHDLKRHKRIHLAVKPYPCQHCKKQFSRKDALKRHVLVKGCDNSLNNKSGSSSTNTTGNGQAMSAGDSSSSPNARRSHNKTDGYVESRGPVNSIKSESNSDGGYYGI